MIEVLWAGVTSGLPKPSRHTGLTLGLPSGHGYQAPALLCLQPEPRCVGPERDEACPELFLGFSKQIHGLRGAFVHAGFNSGPPRALGAGRNVALGASSWAMRFGSILWLARSQTHANPRVGFEEASQGRGGEDEALCSVSKHSAVLGRPTRHFVAKFTSGRSRSNPKLPSWPHPVTPFFIFFLIFF